MTKEIREKLEALPILENADLSKIDIATPNEIIALVDHLIIERICQYDKIIGEMFDELDKSDAKQDLAYANGFRAGANNTALETSQDERDKKESRRVEKSIEHRRKEARIFLFEHEE